MVGTHRAQNVPLSTRAALWISAPRLAHKLHRRSQHFTATVPRGPLMTNMLRTIVLPVTIAIFCALIGISAYLASEDLKAIERHTAQRTDAADTRSQIASVEISLQSIETGQRGYLLTGDSGYLAPYTQALANLPVQFSALRARLANRSPDERAIESEIEKATQAKIADAGETIRLREKGYRHRAFLVVDSNRGKELMDRAHSLLAQLTDMETKRVAEYDAEVKEGIGKATWESALASVIILAMTVIALMAFHHHRKHLERSYATRTEELRAATARVELLTATLASSVVTTLSEMRNQSESLLNVDAGFLPRQGQQRVEWMHSASSHLERVVADLLGDSPANSNGELQVAAAVAVEYPASRTA